MAREPGLPGQQLQLEDLALPYLVNVNNKSSCGEPKPLEGQAPGVYVGSRSLQPA